MRSKSFELNRRSLLGAGAVIGGAAAIGTAASHLAAARTNASRPNIIMIVADDLGFADLKSYGHRSHNTRHLDSLATDGLKFNQAYANSAVCSATRIALITGRYQYRLRAGLDEPLVGSPELGLDANHPTMPSLLQDAGYRTGLIGKWHMGTPPLFGPLKSGYERFYGIYGGATDYFSHSMKPPEALIDQGALIDQDAEITEEGYLTDVFGDEAVRFVEGSKTDGRPFFLSLHFTAPHWPWQPPEDSSSSPIQGNPMHLDGGNLDTYAEMVESLDTNVGKVLSALERLDLGEDTIVIFTSDNGGERFSDVWPLVGAKTELLEGGIRVPLLIKWPKKIGAGIETEQTAMSMDLHATLLSMSGAAQADKYPSDGLDLSPIMIGSSAPVARKLYWRYKAMEQVAYRNGDWKYLKINGQEHLFNLAQDQRERANLKDREPERFEAMKQEFADWNRNMLPYDDSTASHNLKQDNWADRY